MFPRRSPAAMSADSPRGGDDEPRTDEAGDPPGPIWAVVTGQASGTSRYAWSEVNEGDVPAFAPNLADGFYSTGTADTNGQPAYEINGRTDVPTDGTARVRMWPAGDLTYYLFAAPAAAPSLTYGSFPTFDAAGYTMTAAGVWEDTGFNFALPSAGTYALTVRSSATLYATSISGTWPAGQMLARLYDQTAGAAVPNSQVIAAEAHIVGYNFGRSFVITTPIGVTGPTTIRLEAFVVPTVATYTFARCLLGYPAVNGAGGVEALGLASYLKIG